MITFYTAVGKFELRETSEGTHPVIVMCQKEYMVSPQEMLIWSSLMWRISLYDELKKSYLRKEAEAELNVSMRFEDCLSRLISRGLVVLAQSYVGVDSLYDLLCQLYITPINDKPSAKMMGFLYLFLMKGVPFRRSLRIFKAQKLTKDEKLVMSVVRQTQLSTAEVIKCIERGRLDLDTDDKVLDALYDDKDTTCYNIHLSSRTARAQRGVLQAVTNLYLKKLIMFDVVL